MFRFLVANSATLAGLVLMGAVAGQAHGTTITFNPATPTSFTDVSGFTGTFTVSPAYQQARVQFRVRNLTSGNFEISGISLKGDGITPPSSLSFAGVTTLGTTFVPAVGWQALSAPLSNLDYANSLASFSLPAGINIGAEIDIRLQYQDPDGTNVNSSSLVTLQAVPEPSTYALAATALGLCGIAAARRRRAGC